MKQIIVTVAVPYAVEIVRRGCRKAEGLVVWDQGPVAIVQADSSETSIAFNIGSRSASEPAYDILSFDGKTWWPLRDGSRAMSVDAFLGSIGDPDGCFLATLNLSPTTLYSSRAITQSRFDADHTIRQVDVSSRDRRWTLAHLSASRLLFCGGAVYMEGGPPAYFGFYRSPAEPPKCRSVSAAFRMAPANPLTAGSMVLPPTGCDAPSSGRSCFPSSISTRLARS